MNNISSGKTCSKCKITKSRIEFANHKQHKDGLYTQCKSCANKTKRTYYNNNKEKTYKTVSLWREKNKDKVKIYQKKYENGNGKSLYALYNRYKRAAKYREISFHLSREEAYRLFESNCIYCGEIGKGIDRINSNLGYELTNCAPCCGICNKMKLVSTKEQFLEQCTKIVNYNNVCIY